MATSIKKVKFEGRQTILCGYDWEHNLTEKVTLGSQGRKIVEDIVKWLRQDYEENGDKIGKIYAQYYNQPLPIGKVEKIPNGVRMAGGLTGEVVYDLVLKIYVPLLGMSFKATDVHTYRWNNKYGEFEHESTNIF